MLGRTKRFELVCIFYLEKGFLLLEIVFISMEENCGCSFKCKDAKEKKQLRETNLEIPLMLSCNDGPTVRINKRETST